MNNFRNIVKKNTNYDISDWRWLLLEELFDNNYLHNPNKEFSVLPKKIHQIWIGGELPGKYREWTDSWKRLNPTWEYYLWNDQNIRSLEGLNWETYAAIKNPGPRSDMLRFHILNEIGGIYADTDFECLKPIDEFSYLNFFTGIGYPAAIEMYVGILGCVPHFPFIERICLEINKVTPQDLKDKGTLAATSSYFFTKIFFEMYKHYVENVVVFPTDYLYPFPNHKGHHLENGREYIKDCSFAIHYWEISWAQPDIVNKKRPELWIGYRGRNSLR